MLLALQIIFRPTKEQYRILISFLDQYQRVRIGNKLVSNQLAQVRNKDIPKKISADFSLNESVKKHNCTRRKKLVSQFM